MRPTSSARAGGRIGNRLATPVAVAGGWDAGRGAPGPEAGTGEEAGVGRVAGGGAEPPQPAARAMSSNGMRHDLMVDSAAQTPRRGGRRIRQSPRGDTRAYRGPRRAARSRP